MLHNGSTSAHGVRSAASRERVRPLSALVGTGLPSHLVAYTPPAVEVALQAVSDTIPVAPRPPAIVDGSMLGQATWYAAAPPGRCASHFLPKGTVVTVTNLANHATTTCLVDDYEAAPYPRVLDMSPSGFAQLEDPSLGVVDVRISW